VEAGSTEEATRIAHTLKGLSASIGADALSAAAKALEAAHKGGNLRQPELAGTCFGMLVQVQEMLSQALGLGRPAESAAAPPAPSADQAGAAAALKTLVDFLRDDDGEAVAFFEAKRPLLTAVLDQNILSKLQNCLDRFEFGEALELLGKA
jgi:two-component system sensor histidine kinase/response regulator